MHTASRTQGDRDAGFLGCETAGILRAVPARDSPPAHPPAALKFSATFRTPIAAPGRGRLPWIKRLSPKRLFGVAILYSQFRRGRPIASTSLAGPWSR